MAPKGRGGRGKNNPAVSGAPRREFPCDVLFDILTRLPIKSLLRFTIASKSWRTLVSLPAFAAVHFSRSPAELLIHGENTQAPGHIAYAFRPPKPESDQTSGAIYRLNFPLSDGAAAELNIVIGTAPNGVACIIHDHLAQNFTLWNPATGSSLRIPVPETPDPDALYGASAGFGYDPISEVYAIIRIVRYNEPKQPDEAYLFNLETGRWDNFGGVDFRVLQVNCDVVVNGVPYWKAWEHVDLLGPVLKLALFDMSSSAFRTEWFGWARADKKELHLSEVREGQLGAILWERAEEGNLDCRILEVWMRVTNGEWDRTYRFNAATNLPVLGRVVGFFGEVEIMQEIILGDFENWTPGLCIIKLGGNVGVRCCCTLDGMRLSSCSVMRYRESVTRLPKIGDAIII